MNTIPADVARLVAAAEYALDVLKQQTPVAYLGGPAERDKVTARQQAIRRLRDAIPKEPVEVISHMLVPERMEPTPPPAAGPDREANLREAIRKAKVAADKVYGIAWHHLEEISRFELILSALEPRGDVRREAMGEAARIVDEERSLRQAHMDAANEAGKKKEARDFQSMVIAHRQSADAIRAAAGEPEPAEWVSAWPVEEEAGAPEREHDAGDVFAWRPIETAPENEAVIISVGGAVGEAQLRQLGDEDDGWWWANEGPGDYHAERITVRHGNPTHWMPLPDAPGTEAV